MLVPFSALHVGGGRSYSFYLICTVIASQSNNNFRRTNQRNLKQVYKFKSFFNNYQLPEVEFSSFSFTKSTPEEYPQGRSRALV